LTAGDSNLKKYRYIQVEGRHLDVKETNEKYGRSQPLIQFFKDKPEISMNARENSVSQCGVYTYGDKHMIRHQRPETAIIRMKNDIVSLLQGLILYYFVVVGIAGSVGCIVFAICIFRGLQSMI